jgi:hypothetical protein
LASVVHDGSVAPKADNRLRPDFVELAVEKR